MEPLRLPVRLRATTIAAVAVAAIAIASLAGWAGYRQEAGELRESQLAVLAAIADGKVRQLGEWRRERIGDLTYVSTTASFVPALAEARAGNFDGPNVSYARRRLGQLIGAYQYTEAMLLEPDAKIIVAAAPATVQEVEPRDTELAAAAVRERKPVVGDLYRAQASGDLRISVAAPVLDAGGEVVAVVLLRRDPAASILAIVESWPSTISSGEAVLFERSGDEVAYLSGTRHDPAPPLALRLPLSRTDLIPAQAILHGRTGTLDGTDYRGADVVAVVRRVPDTPWILCAKIDRDEMLADARYRGWSVGLIAALVFAMLAAIGLAYFNRRERTLYRDYYLAERGQREAEQETRATLYSIGDAVITVDTTARIRRMNPVAEALTGWTEQDARGRPLAEIFRIVDEDTGRALDWSIQQVLDEGRAIDLPGKILLVRRDGSTCPIADSNSPIRDQSGAVLGAVLVFRDQTHERAVQRQLADDARRLHILFDQAQDGIALVSNGALVQANRQFANLIGRTPEEAARCSVWDWDVNFDTPEKYLAAFPGNLRTPERIETRFRRKDGTLIDVELSITPHELDGRSVNFCIVRDVSERKRAEAELRRSEQEFRDFAEFIPQIAWILGGAGETVYVNGRWAQYTGRVSADSTGSDPWSAIHPEDLAQTLEAWERARQAGHQFQTEHRLRRHDGVYRWFAVSGMPLRDADGRIVRWLGTTSDIDDLKNAEVLLERKVEERTRELVAARDEASAANRAKDIFLATMSHELRTPLNSIIGFTDLMLDGLSGPLTEDQRRQLSIVSKSGHQLLGLVSDVLDISKIERGQLDLRLERLPLRALLEEEWPAFAVEAAKQGLAVAAELPDAAVTVLGDQRRVKQAVNNLLTNAVKYSDRGMITLRAGVEGAFARIEVQDTGLGIPAEELAKIFQPFHRVPGPKGRLREGSGLGLAITRRLIVLMGGEVGVQSEPGRGSRFSFTLPLAPPSTSPAGPVPP
jgi:PAS domain S-box-containing protein